MPTMGGIFILITILLSTLLWADLGSRLIWVFLLGLFGFGAIGFWDDWAKIKRSRGISARAKFIAQWSIAALVALLWVYWAGPRQPFVFLFSRILILIWAFYLSSGQCL